MKHNPYYDESLGQVHIDPNAQLRAQQSRWFQQQEEQRLHALYMRPIQSDFAGLQNVAQQYAPQPRQHSEDIPWGGIAAGAAAGYYLANRPQPVLQPAVVRPEGWKSNVIGWYIAIALVLQFVVAMVVNPDLFWLIGLVVWIPAWAAGISHQLSVAQHNRHLLEKQS